MKNKYIDVGLPLPYNPETDSFMDLSQKHIEREKEIPDVKSYPLAIRVCDGYEFALKGGEGE